MAIHEISALYLVATAAKTLEWAQDNCPGEDLGQEARAICWLELRDALKQINWEGFDPRASLEYYKQQRK